MASHAPFFTTLIHCAMHAACYLQQKGLTGYKSIQNQLTVELFVKWSQDALGLPH